LPLARGITLIRCGGHFAGGTVLHWAAGGEGRGALLSGDIVQLIPDRKYVSFMRSYPNIIPLSAPAVARIGAMLEPWPFDVIYGAFFDRVIPRGGKEAVKRSVTRYIAIIEGDGTAEQVLPQRDGAGARAVGGVREPMPPLPPTDTLQHSATAVFFAGFRAAWQSVLAYVVIGTYVGIGALTHDFGFGLGWAVASTALVWARPAQVILVSALAAGAAPVETALAVGVSSA